ncbi:hypothetical protein D3C84_897830 [compost metagenome]
MARVSSLSASGALIHNRPRSTVALPSCMRARSSLLSQPTLSSAPQRPASTRANQRSRASRSEASPTLSSSAWAFFSHFADGRAEVAAAA